MIYVFISFTSCYVAVTEWLCVTDMCEAAQEARLQSLAMQLAESDCTLRVTNTHLCSADSARAKEK